uniref:Putative glycosyltransferase n=1 Tax=Streptomyces versipellis TaxID=67375 RepID=A0A0B6VLQ5_9ACTN|nr:putative glycosyltransferase [Streptomyces versipellis]
MRVLFVAAAMKPHFFPLVTLAWAFRAAGHEVRVAGQPRIVEEVTRAGLAAIPVGAAHDLLDGTMRVLGDKSVDLTQARRRMASAASSEEPWGLREGGAVRLSEEQVRQGKRMTYEPHINAARSMAEDLVPFARHWRPDLVVTDPLPYVSALVAGVLGVPLVRHLWGPYTVQRLAGQSGPSEGNPLGEWPAELVELYSRYGVEVSSDHAVANVDACPLSMQVDGIRNRIPVRYLPYNGTGVVPGWLRRPAERPRVCVTWGTTTMALGDSRWFMVPQIVDALADLDVEAVVTLSEADRQRLGSVPKGVRLVSGLPLDWLLPTCGAIVNQAGAGTVLTAAAHGVPQVCVPQLTDQPFNAVKLAATGAGVTLDMERADRDDIKSAVHAALTDEAPKEAARRLREEIEAQPVPAEIVDTLLRSV